MILEADCIDAMRDMDEASVDAIVTDPPYGLEFMGKEWDRLGATNEATGGDKDGDAFSLQRGQSLPFGGGGNRIRYGANVRAAQQWHQAWATEALRVLKPGGHLLAFGGTRTYHRLACAIEDAGFEIRDSVIWHYGSGFPKSLDVSKAIDKAAGVEREVVGENEEVNVYNGRHAFGDSMVGEDYGKSLITAPATPEAQQWQGWGTALKPAHEPIVVARKPLIGTVAQNVQTHGTGALNVDGCRIGASHLPACWAPNTGPYHANGKQGCAPGCPVGDNARKNKGTGMGYRGGDAEIGAWDGQRGRWPANVALSHLPECERVGTRRVKSQSGGDIGGDGSIRNEVYGGRASASANKNRTDLDGTEQVEAWRCAEGCSVAELDRQSGTSTAPPIGSTAKLKRPQSPHTVSLPPMELPNGYGDTGGASRFFLTVTPDTLCVLCGLLCVESAENPSLPSEAPSDTVPVDAQDAPPPSGEGSSLSSDTPASPVGESLRTTPPTDTATTSTAPSDAAGSQPEQSDHAARSVANPCGRCTTAIAQSVARWQQGQTPESAVGPASMPAHKKRILTRCLALNAGDRASIDTTLIIRTLSEWSGSVTDATPPSTPTNATASEYAPRAFYCAKSSRAERNAGLDGFEEREAQDHNMLASTERIHPDGRRHENKPAPPRANHHPTVKPIDLMRWLVRLVTPPDGTVLDPFTGSGTTGIAATLEGFSFIGIEREAEYAEIAKARIAWWERHPEGMELVQRLNAEAERKAVVDAGQLELL